jgi:para-nitrobenzyl esterase
MPVAAGAVVTPRRAGIASEDTTAPRQHRAMQPGSAPTRRTALAGGAVLAASCAALPPVRALAASSKSQNGAGVVANTHHGKVLGTIVDGIRVFKGIPYGTVLTDENRFRPPRHPKPWTGVRDALSFGPMCPQVDRERPSLTASWTYDKDAAEDCLVLNVWTPGLRDHRKRPVMVWLHGGGFSSLSGARNVFDGTRLCRKGDVVVVTLNHRLNVFGHLYLAQLAGAEFAESGNVGMLDIIAALRWVHATIAEFGGDPANVTVFGQSGGGAKVSTLMAMPQARGLFHRAVVQSGSHLEALSPDEATRHAVALLAALELKPNEVPRLLKLPTEKIVSGLAKVMAGPAPRPNYSPVVDGHTLPRHPWTPDAPTSSAQVPLLVGTTRTETTALIGAGDPSTFDLEQAGLRRRLTAWLPDRDIDRIIAGFRSLQPNASPSDLFFAITTDRRVRQQAWAQAERKAAQNGAPVFLYELDWPTPVEGGKWRSPHSLDLAFVFDNVAKSASMVGAGPGPQALADQMSAAWLAFARTGNPNAAGLPAWPAFRPNERATMVFDMRPRVLNDFRGDERALLASVPLYRVSR